jgi:hypothetical protein
MLSNTLNTNEVKDAAAAEVELQRISSNERKTVFAVITETPNAPHRLSISHTEIGAGVDLRRRSVVRVDKTVTGSDSSPHVVSAYVVLDAPVGALSATTEIKNALAELSSFCFTAATSTLLYDGTGNGASALITGGL